MMIRIHRTQLSTHCSMLALRGHSSWPYDGGGVDPKSSGSSSTAFCSEVEGDPGRPPPRRTSPSLDLRLSDRTRCCGSLSRVGRAPPSPLSALDSESPPHPTACRSSISAVPALCEALAPPRYAVGGAGGACGMRCVLLLGSGGRGCARSGTERRV